LSRVKKQKCLQWFFQLDETTQGRINWVLDLGIFSLLFISSFWLLNLILKPWAKRMTADCCTDEELQRGFISVQCSNMASLHRQIMEDYHREAPLCITTIKIIQLHTDTLTELETVSTYLLTLSRSVPTDFGKRWRRRQLRMI